MAQKEIDLHSLPSEPVEHRLFLASSQDSTAEVLNALSQDSFWFVRDRVAANIRAPHSCLQKLLQDPDFRVRAEAENTLAKQAANIKKPLAAQIATAGAKASEAPSHATPSAEHEH